MREWTDVLRFVRDNVTLLVFVVVVAVMASAWILFEVLRGHKSRDELFRLRRKLAELERERAGAGPVFRDPLVLSSRWVGAQRAATTSDGGCLLYVDKVLPATGSADVTVRVDGYPVHQNRNIRIGERLEASGKYGTYILELCGVEGSQANVAIALRNRHQPPGDPHQQN